MEMQKLVLKAISRPIPALLRRHDTSTQRVLIPIDETTASFQAVEHVAAMADYMNVTAHVLNVQRPVMAGDITPFLSARMVEDRRRERGERLLKRAQRILSGRLIDCHTEIVFGPPADQIVRRATTAGCRQIVIGSRGAGVLARLLRPSVANEVVRTAPVPVTVVKDWTSRETSAVPGPVSHCAPLSRDDTTRSPP
jgi:nucleotide-binding universal stress UspA family protein